MEPKAFARTISRKRIRRKRLPAPERAVRIVTASLVAYLLLAGLHKGEFWPFSFYPDYAQAGSPWTRALVRELPTESAVLETLQAAWPRQQETIYSDVLPGKPLALSDHDLSSRLLTQYVAEPAWTPERLAALAVLFEREGLEDRQLILFRARGEPDGATTGLTITPVAFISSGGATPLFLGATESDDG